MSIGSAKIVKNRPAVEGCEALAVEFEDDSEDRPRRLAVDFAARFRVVGDRGDLRIRKDAGVELRGLFGPIIEPETGGNSLKGGHVVSPRENCRKRQ